MDNLKQQPRSFADFTNRNPSATKSGPGRYHKSGHEKASPIKSKGAPRGFVLHSSTRTKLRGMNNKVRKAIKRQMTNRTALPKDSARIHRFVERTGSAA